MSDYDEIEPPERRPVVSQEATCRACDGDLHQIESSFACQDDTCSRFAIPVNEFGNTDAEQEEEAQADGERREARNAR